ncbi:MAG: DUF4436 family protein [Actinomycetes bacterium]
MGVKGIVARRPRGRWLIALVAVVLAVVYVVAIFSYARSGQSKTVSDNPPEVDNGVNVHINLTAIDPARNSATFQIALMPAGDYSEKSGAGSVADVTFSKPVKVTMWDQTVGSISRVIPAGEVYGARDSVMYVSGDYSRYPFDKYTLGWFGSDFDPASLADNSTSDATSVKIRAPLISVDAVDAAGKPIMIPDPDDPTKMIEKVLPLGVMAGWEPTRLQGWTESWNLSHFLIDDPEGFDESGLYLDLTVKRSGGTLAIVVVMLVLMVTLAVIALAVSSRVALQRRRIEATMSSWLAGMLFALIPLRTFLPGAPPVGSWMDILVFFWVLFGLMAAIVIFIGSWLRFSRPPEYALRAGVQYPDARDLPAALAKQPDDPPVALDSDAVKSSEPS